MGSFEKLVVLTVLFLVVLVLGVTLNSGDTDTSGAPGPLHSALQRQGDEAARDAGSGGPGGGGPGAEGGFLGDRERAEASGEDTLALLSSAVEDGEAAGRETGAARPKGVGILVNATGLETNPAMAGMRVYRVREDDTWTALSERFYGTRAYVTLLRQANDDPAALVPGQSILVPIEDITASAGDRAPRRPAPRRASSGDDAGTRSASRSTPSAGGTPSSYTVAAGDSLSVISLKVYGTSRRWGEIYEANRDVLPNPDTLQVGVKLRIP